MMCVLGIEPHVLKWESGGCFPEIVVHDFVDAP